MTVEQFIRHTTKKLADAGIETPRLDCLILLEDVLCYDRAHLLAHPESVIPGSSLTILNNYITQRKQHVPLAHIRGRAAFYGRDFIVNKYVLVPRPETEVMIDMLKTSSLPARPKIADIGTGSGCIGIAAALELPESEVFLYDVDAQALKMARKNAQTYTASVQLAQQDLLEQCPEQFDVILANLPYVPDSYSINQAAAHEPRLALFAGQNGLDLYQRLWLQIANLKHQPQHVFTEALPQQHQPLAALAQSAGYAVLEAQGLIQHFVTGKTSLC